MIKIEQIRATGTQGLPAARLQAAAVRSNVVSISAGSHRADPAPQSTLSRKFALGRKGRHARIRRRLLDGFFITTALGTAALLWWSAN